MNLKKLSFLLIRKNFSEEILKLVNLAENHSINELINFFCQNQKQTLNILNDNNFSNEDCFLIVRTMLRKSKNL